MFWMFCQTEISKYPINLIGPLKNIQIPDQYNDLDVLCPTNTMIWMFCVGPIESIGYLDVLRWTNRINWIFRCFCVLAACANVWPVAPPAVGRRRYFSHQPSQIYTSKAGAGNAEHVAGTRCWYLTGTLNPLLGIWFSWDPKPSLGVRYCWTGSEVPVLNRFQTLLNRRRQ